MSAFASRLSFLKDIFKNKLIRYLSIAVVLPGVLIGGYFAVTSVGPSYLRVTNQTATSFTVTWMTKQPSKGVVLVKEGENKSFLPGPLALINSDKFYDDRDVAKAELAAGEIRSQEASKQVEGKEEKIIDPSKLNFEVNVTQKGKYHAHHITVSGLTKETDYSFRIGNGLRFWGKNVLNNDDDKYKFGAIPEGKGLNVKTLPLPDQDFVTPNPSYGTIQHDNIDVDSDVLVFAYLNDSANVEDSLPLSSSLNNDAGWYIDIANGRWGNGYTWANYENESAMEVTEFLFVEDGKVKQNRVDLSFTQNSPTSLFDLAKANSEESANNSILYGLKEILTPSKVYAACPGNVEGDYSACFCNHGGTKWQIAGEECGSPPETEPEEEPATPPPTNNDAGGGCTQHTCTGDYSCNPGETCGNCADSLACSCPTTDTGKVPAGSTCPTSGDTGGRGYCPEGQRYDPNTQSCIPDRISADEDANCGGEGQVTCDTTTHTGTCDSGLTPSSGICVRLGSHLPQCGAGLECSRNPVAGTVKCRQSRNPEASIIYCCSNGEIIVDGKCVPNCVSHGLSALGKSCCEGLHKTGARKICCNNGETSKLGKCVHNSTINSECDHDADCGDPDEWVCKKGLGFLKANKCVYTVPVKQKNGNSCSSDAECQSGNCLAIPGSGGSKKCAPESESNLLNKLLTKYLDSRVYANSAMETEEGYLIINEPGTYRAVLNNEIEKKLINGESDKNFLFYDDKNKNGKYDEGEEVDAKATVVTLEKESDVFNFQLQEGYNFVSFPFVPTDGTNTGTMSSMLQFLNNKGIEATVMASFDGGWKAIDYRQVKGSDLTKGKLYGENDRAVNPGQGYVIRVINGGGTVAIPGYKVAEPVSLNVSKSWNLVGIHGLSNYNGYTADKVIQSMKDQGVTVDILTQRIRGRYESRIIKDVDGSTRKFGSDYPIEEYSAYFIHSENKGSWTPEK